MKRIRKTGLQRCAALGNVELPRVYALMFQQPELALDAACVTGQASVRSDDSMARDDDGDGIVPNRAANRKGQTPCPVHA